MHYVMKLKLQNWFIFWTLQKTKLFTKYENIAKKNDQKNCKNDLSFFL